MGRELELRSLVTRELGGEARFIIASNREPFVHENQQGQIVWRQPAGGLTAALGPLLERCGGVWVAQGTGTADRDVVDRHSRVMVPPGRPAYALRRLWIPEKLSREYYCGLANRALWPLCHNAYRRPRFSTAEWESYRKVNEIFAAAIAEEAAGGPALIFVQDYHLALVPRLLRRHSPNLVIAHFWHIPWPAPDTFRALPWSREVLDGLLGSDLIGFQLSRDAANFVRCLEQAGRTLVDNAHGPIFGDMHTTVVRNFPIGIDFERHVKMAAGAETQAAIRDWKLRLGDVRIGIGIDRIDYTKGIPERLRGLDLFFEQHAEWRGKLVFVQVGVPSRNDIPEYRALSEQIQSRISALNERWGTANWRPVFFVHENLPPVQMMALHRLADLCLVTSLHDGMNLVAKEFVASRDDLDGVLVLSRFAGAAEELSSAVLVNPFAEEDIAGGIREALTLPRAERMSRMLRMRSAVRTNDIQKWAADILWAAMRAARAGRRGAAAAGTSPLYEIPAAAAAYS